MLTPSETLPLQGPFKGEGLKAHSRPLKGAGRGGGDARQTDEQLRWGAATRSKTALVPSKQHRRKPAFSRAHSALDKLSHGLCRRPFRRFRAKPDKQIVDGQAASPSSWKTPFMAAWMAS